MSLDVVIKFK